MKCIASRRARSKARRGRQSRIAAVGNLIHHFFADLNHAIRTEGLVREVARCARNCRARRLLPIAEMYCRRAPRTRNGSGINVSDPRDLCGQIPVPKFPSQFGGQLAGNFCGTASILPFDGDDAIHIIVTRTAEISVVGPRLSALGPRPTRAARRFRPTNKEPTTDDQRPMSATALIDRAKLYRNQTFGSTDIPGRRSCSGSRPASKVIFTGMRWTTLTKFPVAFSGGKQTGNRAAGSGKTLQMAFVVLARSCRRESSPAGSPSYDATEFL